MCIMLANVSALSSTIKKYNKKDLKVYYIKATGYKTCRFYYAMLVFIYPTIIFASGNTVFFF